MLVEPGPIVPLDLAWFEAALGRLDPLDPLPSGGPEFAAAADAIDTILAAAGPLDPPDDVEDDDTRAIGAWLVTAGARVDRATAGFPAVVTQAVTSGQANLARFEENLDTPLGSRKPNTSGGGWLDWVVKGPPEAGAVDMTAEQADVDAVLSHLPDDAPGA